MTIIACRRRVKFTKYRRVKIATRRRGNLANIGRTKKSNEYDPASESLSMRMRAMGYAGGRQSDFRRQTERGDLSTEV